MNPKWLLLLGLITANANAFPVILAGAGALAFGTAFIPMVGVALILMLGLRLMRLPRSGLLAMALSSITVLAMVVVSWADENREAILANTQTLGAPAERTTTIPYPYVGPEEQAASPSRIGPDEFYDLLNKRQIRVIRVDLETQIFPDFGLGATATQIHEDPAPIVALAKKNGPAIVLVDERGTTASAVADELNTKYGTHIRFLQGGTNALNSFAWQRLDATGDAHAVLPADIPAFKAAHHPAIISTTNVDEFMNYGWMHGLTITLPVFLSGTDALATKLEGQTVLITAAESHFSGDTWILLDMLRARGIDAYFMQPTREELLVKPAYFTPYKNADRYIGAGQTFGYVVGKPEVRFLDFQPALDWARTKNRLPRTDHIDMEVVAKGGLAQALAKLDASASYVGLAYDRRTFYHSILAGEVLTGSGVRWMGIDTQPGLFSRADITDQDLIDPALATRAKIQYRAIAVIGCLYGLLPGSAAWILWLNAVLCFAGAVACAQQRHWPARVAALAAFSALTFGFWIAYVEATTVWISDASFSLLQIAGATAGWLLVRQNRVSHRFGRDGGPGPLPDKIALLQKAAEHGYTVEKGFVVSGSTPVKLPKWALDNPVIVRSAAVSESSTAHTVGIYESVHADGEASVREAIRYVQEQIVRAGEIPCCLIQPLLTGQTFGVAMFGTGTDGHLFICEGGEGDSVTAGTGASERVALPVWQNKGLTRPVRKIRKALMGLNRGLGATTIEWALSKSGRLTILQVSTDTLGRPGLRTALKLARRSWTLRASYIPMPIEHSTSLGAAVVAAMGAPADQISVGGVRLVPRRSLIHARAIQLVDIAVALGRLPLSAFVSVPGQLLVAAFESADAARDATRRTISIATTAPTAALAQQLAYELGQVSRLYGRYSRLATTALELKNESRCHDFERAFLSTQIGNHIEQLEPDSAAEYIAQAGFSSVTSFDPGQGHGVDAELVSPVIQTTESPLAWLKDKCAVTMMVELGRLGPAIAELHRRGAAESLLMMLPSYAGELPQGVTGTTGMTQGTLRQILEGGPTSAQGRVQSWGIPRSGLELYLAAVGEFVPGAALYLETADMAQLALIQRAGALVIRSGSSLSHLLQHARRLNIPHVIGLDSAAGLVGGSVRINANGEVHRA